MKNNLILFSRLFVIFYFLFLGFSGSWYTNIFIPFTLIFGILVLVTDRVTYFNIFLGLYLLEVAYRLPVIPNVVFFSSVTALSFLCIQGYNYLKNRERYLEKSLEQFYLILILNLSALYFWTFFNKLNTDFIKPDCSCATFLLNNSTHLPELISNQSLLNFIYYLTIIGTLIVEAMIPIFIVTRKYRVLGILLGFIFHLGLAITHFDFTAIMNALYSFLLPSVLVTKIISEETISTKLSRILKIATPVLLLLISWASWQGGFSLSFKLAFIAWFVITLWMVYLMYKVRIWMFLFEPLPNMEWRSWQIIFPVVLLLNGLQPYIGLKTEFSFSMYSNLRTEEGKTNHYIITRPYYLADFQNEVVYIHETQINGLKRFVGSNLGITYFELNRIIEKNIQEQNFNQPLSYTYKGVNYTLTDLRGFDGADQPNGAVLNKVLRFREVQLGEDVHCLH